MLGIARSRLIDEDKGEGDYALLSELVLALDKWIRKGGAIPDRWLAARIEAAKERGDPLQQPRCSVPRLMKDRVGGSHSVVHCILEAGHDGPHCVEVP
jgi:hypothetical protein